MRIWFWLLVRLVRYCRCTVAKRRIGCAKEFSSASLYTKPAGDPTRADNPGLYGLRFHAPSFGCLQWMWDVVLRLCIWRVCVRASVCLYVCMYARVSVFVCARKKKKKKKRTWFILILLMPKVVKEFFPIEKYGCPICYTHIQCDRRRISGSRVQMNICYWRCGKVFNGIFHSEY